MDTLPSISLLYESCTIRSRMASASVPILYRLCLMWIKIKAQLAQSDGCNHLTNTATLTSICGHYHLIFTVIITTFSSGTTHVRRPNFIRLVFLMFLFFMHLFSPLSYRFKVTVLYILLKLVNW